MNSRENMNDISSFFIYLEEKYDLFDLKHNDIFFWKLIRIPIWLKICKKIGMFEDVPIKNDDNLIKKIIRITEKEILIFKKNIRWNKSIHDTLLLESPRKIEVKGKKIDTNTEFIKNFLINKNKDVFSIEIDVLDNKSFKLNNKMIASNSLIVQKLYLTFSKVNFDNMLLELFRIIQNEIHCRFNVNIEIDKIAKEAILVFRYKYKYYDKILSALKPKNLILVCSYGNEHIIAAAKKNRTNVIEVQHGTISRHHLGYNFPEKKDIKYLPDNIFVYGEYWRKNINMPTYKMDRIYSVGNLFLKSKIDQYKKNNIKKNTIIFLSQWTISELLADIAVKFAKENCEYKVIYKLHPREIDGWEKKYPILYKGRNLYNFNVIESNEVDLHYLLSTCEYQVGVYSTSVFEGISLGCKTILVDLPGIEYMDSLIDDNYVKLAKNHKEIIKMINQYDCDEVNIDYFFKDIEMLDEILEMF